MPDTSLWCIFTHFLASDHWQSSHSTQREDMWSVLKPQLLGLTKKEHLIFTCGNLFCLYNSISVFKFHLLCIKTKRSSKKKSLIDLCKWQYSRQTYFTRCELIYLWFDLRLHISKGGSRDKGRCHEVVGEIGKYGSFIDFTGYTIKSRHSKIPLRVLKLTQVSERA